MNKIQKYSFDVFDSKQYFFSISKLSDLLGIETKSLPISIHILLENVLRHCTDVESLEKYCNQLSKYISFSDGTFEIPFMPSRVLMQDFTGIPALVDLAAMRNAVAKEGINPAIINPQIPVDLVVDHSVQVDHHANSQAFNLNKKLEYKRNEERYKLIKWAEKSLKNFRVVPPGTGIVHQVNLEYLSPLVDSRKFYDKNCIFPDTLIGTDSHTTMINALGVLAWGVGGIEAEAVLLGQPYYMAIPQVIGVKLHGKPNFNVTATDIVLFVTNILRKENVVGSFVEFFGDGLNSLNLPDRATISNMCPEYGATCALFPIDNRTLEYASLTGRTRSQLELIKGYSQKQNMFREKDLDEKQFSKVVEIDLTVVEPSMAGPKRPQDRVNLENVPSTFQAFAESRSRSFEKQELFSNSSCNISDIDHGAVVISAITSCTNTSNPYVMIGAGLLAKNAIEKGLTTKPWVKTSLAPGSQVVMDYLEEANLIGYLDQLGFSLVGFGCTTCIGNSGPLLSEVSKIIKEKDLVVAAVLSGNRNFEGRIHSEIQANYLGSPMLVVAYAIAGNINVNLTNDPMGFEQNGTPVFLKDIWPFPEEIIAKIKTSVKQEFFSERYKNVFLGDEEWRTLNVNQNELFEWDKNSNYIREVPFFSLNSSNDFDSLDLTAFRALVILGDSISTDHISPAGAIQEDGPAGQYLKKLGVNPINFNTFGARRGNHEVMMRGTFANIRMRNLMVPDKEGDFTIHYPSGELLRIFEASERYKNDNVPLIVIAGKEYGCGSSRDWAAKGPLLLGVRVVLAESFERIHRNNLIGMGILPLQFQEGQNAQSLNITNDVIFDLRSFANISEPNSQLPIHMISKSETKSFIVDVRLDTEIELVYFNNGGVLQTVLNRMNN